MHRVSMNSNIKFEVNPISIQGAKGNFYTYSSQTYVGHKVLKPG